MPVKLLASVACTVKLNVPSSVAVPDKVPLLAKVMPAGNAPLVIA